MREIVIKGKEQVLTSKELEELFLSVEWSSGHYPDKLEIAMRNYATVYTAWDGDRLIGLLSAMDDGVMTAYIHYLLVRPEYQGRGVGKQLLEHYHYCLSWTEDLNQDKDNYRVRIGLEMPSGFPKKHNKFHNQP